MIKVYASWTVMEVKCDDFRWARSMDVGGAGLVLSYGPYVPFVHSQCLGVSPCCRSEKGTPRRYWPLLSLWPPLSSHRDLQNAAFDFGR